jgi:hypothetical protein
MAAKKPSPVEAALPSAPADPWSCAACCAPGLRSAFRVKSQSYCWDCFFDRPQRETATFTVNKDAAS